MNHHKANKIKTKNHKDNKCLHQKSNPPNNLVNKKF